MLEKQKIKIKNNNWKINIILLGLLIANIILFAGLIIHFFYFGEDFEISFSQIDNGITIIAAIIILGFISTRLPQFRQLGDSSIYEIGYLIIIGIFSIILSYFNKSTNTEGIIAPFMEMFKVMSVILILTIIAAKTKPFKDRLKGNLSRRNQIFCLIIFVALGIFASLYYVDVDGIPANMRSLIIMISGLFGGPFVGIPAGIITGTFRFIQGGSTALPCALSTIISGIIGSLIFIWNDKKFLRTIPSFLLMFLFTGFEMLIIVILTPPNISIPFIANVYPFTLFGSTLGMILFIMIIKEEKKDSKKEISYEELKIRELENIIDNHSDKIDDLESELEELRKK